MKNYATHVQYIAECTCQINLKNETTNPVKKVQYLVQEY